MTTKEVLLRAAEIIEEMGHLKGWYEDSNGVCILGAINLAEGRVAGKDGEIPQQLRDYLGVNSDSGIIQWNDADERKEHHVTLALRATAYTLSEGA